MDIDTVTYRYKLRFFPLIWMAIFLPLSIFLGKAMCSESGLIDGSALFVATLFGVTLIGCLLLTALADVTVDDIEISRSAFGVTWQKARWDQIVQLTVVPSTNPEDGACVRQFVFRSKDRSVSLFSRRILFQERANGMNELLQKIDACVARNHIVVRDLKER